MNLKTITKFLKEFGTEAEKRTYGDAPEELITPTDRGDVIIKGLDDSDIKALNKALEEDGYKGPGINMGRLGELFDQKGQLKLNLFEGNIEQSLDTLLTNVQQQNKELFAYMRRPSQSMEEMASLAQTAGFPRIAEEFIKRQPGQMLPPEKLVGGIILLIKFGKELQFGASKLKTLQGDAKVNLYKQHQMLAGVYSALASNVSGLASEYGRGLQVLRNVSKLNLSLPKLSDDLDMFVTNMGQANIDLYANQFLSLNNATARANYIEKTKLAKGSDVLMEAYINSLLSSPVTHMVNIAGNAGFQIQTLAERGLAGVIGNFRRTLKLGPEDQAYVGDAMAEAHGLMMAQADAFKIMGRTFISGKTSDDLSKIDLRVKQAYGDDDNLASIMQRASEGDYTQLLVNGMSVMTRLPGRFLATEDAYFKVVTRRRVQYREAFRRSQIEYENAINANVPKDEARKLAESKYRTILDNPPADVKEMMTAEALKQTFQTPVKGKLASVGASINSNPITKSIVPFFNTPTNIINEVFDRTLRYDKLYTTLKKGEGEEFDKALSKLAIGNGIAMTMFGLANGFFGDEVIVTGQGPSDRRARKFMKFPQYSLSFKVPGSDNEYRSYTFSRFDPMSGLLAMGADLSHYLKHEDDPTAIESMIKAYTLSVAEYAHNLPFLQGISELTSAIGGFNNTTEDLGQRLINFGVSKGTDIFAGTAGATDRATFGLLSYLASTTDIPFMGSDSFLATMERVNNPEASNTMPTQKQLEGNALMSPTTKAFYERLNYYKSRNSYFSNQLPPKLNFWGERLYQTEGRFDEFINPVRVKSSQYTTLDKELIRLSERTGKVISAHPRKIGKSTTDRFQLSGLEYNELVMLTNEIDENGLLPGDDGYDLSSSLLPSLTELVESEEYNLLEYDEDKFKFINAIVSDRRSDAKGKLEEQNPRLGALLIEIN